MKKLMLGLIICLTVIAHSGAQSKTYYVSPDGDVEPGSGGIGLSTLNGYRLQNDAPCINAGAPIEMMVRRDFYGNKIE